MPPSSIHFNGSVNLPDTGTVMAEIGSRIPAGLRRIPDGEPGERGNWIVFQVRMLATMPEFEQVRPGDAVPLFHLAPGVTAESVRWPDLGYATAYSASFEVFRELQADGVIPAAARFQIQYPTPLAPLIMAVVPEEFPAVSASYESALLADLDRAMAGLPHDAIAVQWDVAPEFGLLEGAFGPGSRVPVEHGKASLEKVTADVVRCVDRVPADVPAGLHMCYGDLFHQHFTQPGSLEMQVRFLNAVAASSSRAIDFASFTVPQARSDEAYFASLRDLQAGPATELSFGIVPYHPAAQAAGTTQRQVAGIDAALAASPSGPRGWAISTECGMGRASADEVPGLLDLHREILGQFTP
jgi:hypothetical protein